MNMYNYLEGAYICIINVYRNIFDHSPRQNEVAVTKFASSEVKHTESGLNALLMFRSITLVLNIGDNGVYDIFYRY